MANGAHASAALDGIVSGSDEEWTQEPDVPPPPRRVSRARQFAAVLRKNWLLQVRASRAWYTLGAGGWAALAIELLLPALFFALLCIPKAYLSPVRFPRALAPPLPLDASRWALRYDGPASAHEFRALLLFAPNDTRSTALMRAFARSVACPADPAARQPPASSLAHASFYALFRPPLPQPACDDRGACLASDACSSHLLGSQLLGFASEAEALVRTAAQPQTVDAVISFDSPSAGKAGQQQAGYTLRLNHTQVPPTRARLSDLSSRPDQQYRKYWLFANLQLHLDRALLGAAASPGRNQPALLDVSVKPFPWPAGVLDAGAAVAAAAFNLLLVLAFLAPTKGIVASLVREKELRLREGMRILGLQDGAYWASWALVHCGLLGCTMLACALVSLYPFRHSSFSLLLAVLWLAAAALVAFAYALSTLFNKSRVAGLVAPLAYSLAMLPGYLMPSLQPYGGLGWYAACLLPPSAISLFANLLLQVEAAGQGLRWDALGRSVTAGPAAPFSARVVLLALAADALLYGAAAAYLDRVLPREFGARARWDWPFRRRRARPPPPPPTPGSPRWPPGDGGDGPAVAVRDLRKVFPAPGGGAAKTAVDGLSLDVHGGEILALLGPNGAGKTTTISVLTGMLEPSGGDARIGGRSIRGEMGAIRQGLGVCPQFDILWPEISVREHLQLYAALKGYDRAAADAAAASAAAEVGLGEKLDAAAGDLSGGQRRKLSVAICFLGGPAVVILDEPTSGMDPYTRRFTWEVIRRHRRGRATILTTHSMEEADALADRIAIMAGGRLAAEGTPLALKRRFGVGYSLTLVRPREGEGTDQRFAELLGRHVRGATLADAGPAEAVFRLPKEQRSRLPAALRALDAEGPALGLQSYGLAETTLEEVFLEVTQQRGGKGLIGFSAPDARDPAREAARPAGVPQLALDVLGDGDGEGAERGPLLAGADAGAGGGADEFAGDRRRPTRLRGAALFCQQLRALLAKRALSARRDRLALWTQLGVPLLLVAGALAARAATSGLPQEPRLPLTREACEFGAPSWLAASAPARANASAWAAFGAAYTPGSVRPSEAERLWEGPPLAPVAGTLDAALLAAWGGGRPAYSAVFGRTWGDSPQVLSSEQAVALTLLLNQSAPHALPSALNAASSALLRAATGDAAAGIAAANHPLPTLPREAAVQLSRTAGDLLLVLLTVTAAALLSASFAVFLVRERASASKAVQLVSGAHPAAFWLANLLWDGAVFAVAAAGILAAFAAARVPQFRGPQLGAFAALLAGFGAAALPHTYLLHFLFQDEMRAMQRINSLGVLLGLVGFVGTWVLDLVGQLTRKHGVRSVAHISRIALMAVSPHYNLARGMYAVSATHTQAPEQADASPFAWDSLGQWLACLAAQAAAFAALTLLLESAGGSAALRRLWQARLAPRVSNQQGSAEPYQEDQDVARERYRIQDGRGQREGDQVLLAALAKAFRQGWRRPPLPAVAGLSLGIPAGECCGLLGVNGAGKTTAFRIVTGEAVPDAGDASVCGASVLTALRDARKTLGYCPQASALPSALTGREVLRLYGRLRGVPPGLLEATVTSLLARLDLTDAADSGCGSYSGGMQRKLSVAVALVGAPPVVLLDEPSTGMDPGAKRFLWDILRKQVIGQGHTVLLTSHSMEECEALCGRLAIMAAGRLRCLGSPQHLKARFGAGYALTLRLAAGRQAGPVSAAVAAAVPGAAPGEGSDGTLSYSLPREGLDLAGLFEALEAQKQALGIEEFSVSQATLEHVFVRLAQAQ